MSEKENILNDKETQDTQLELDVSTFSFAPATPVATEEAPAEKPMSKKQAKKAAKQAKKAAKAEKKANKCKKGDKKEKKCKKCVFLAWLTFFVTVGCVLAPIATLVAPGYKPFADASLFDGFLASTRFACDLLNIGNLNLALIDNAPIILTAGKQGFVYNCVLLVLPAVVLFTLILALVASGSKKPCRVAKASAILTFLYFFGLCFSFCFISVRSNNQLRFDLASLIATAILFFLAIFSASASKKKAKAKVVAEEVAVAEVAEQTNETEENVETNEQDAEIEGVCGVVEEETETEEQSPYGLNFGSTYMKNKQALMGFEPVQAKSEPAETSVSYDWFLESLTADEKREFVSLFVYKSLPGTASLPDYVAGGDNYMFFRRFFLNLGKYRDSVSANLLEKIYQYMTRVY